MDKPDYLVTYNIVAIFSAFNRNRNYKVRKLQVLCNIIYTIRKYYRPVWRCYFRKSFLAFEKHKLRLFLPAYLYIMQFRLINTI